MSVWIFFRPGTAGGRKTMQWDVVTKDSGVSLGAVKWFALWRRYAFFPVEGTCFEQDCLRTIASFCEGETRSHRENTVTARMARP